MKFAAPLPTRAAVGFSKRREHRRNEPLAALGRRRPVLPPPHPQNNHCPTETLVCQPEGPWRTVSVRPFEILATPGGRRSWRSHCPSERRGPGAVLKDPEVRKSISHGWEPSRLAQDFFEIVHCFSSSSWLHLPGFFRLSFQRRFATTNHQPVVPPPCFSHDTPGYQHRSGEQMRCVSPTLKIPLLITRSWPLLSSG
jgi:hypothetical protein